MESVECRDMFQLHIVCKDSKVIRYLVYCCGTAAAAAVWDKLWSQWSLALVSGSLCAAIGIELSTVRVLRLGAMFLFLVQFWLGERPC